MFKVNKNIYFIYFQLTFTCSKSTIETLEKGVKYANNKSTTMTSPEQRTFWCFYC